MITVLGVAVAGVPWAIDMRREALDVAIIGALPEDRTALASAVDKLEPDVLLFTGIAQDEALRPFEPSASRRVFAAASKKPNKKWMRQFDGIGVDGIPPAPYSHFDANVGGTRWRFVTLTTQQAPFRQWEEQSFWLPKVVDKTSFDRLVVLLDAPVHTLAEGQQKSVGAHILLGAVQDRSDPLSFAMLVAGNTDTNELFSPGGRFGELHLVAGGSRETEVGFLPSGGGGLIPRLEQEPGFRASLESLGEGPDRFEGIGGFWMLSITKGNAILDFHREDKGVYEVVHRMVRDDQGWHLP